MFTIKINTGGAAFRDEEQTDKHGDFILDPNAHEVRRILKNIINRLEAGDDEGAIMDMNGNRAGEWKYN